MGNNPGSKWLRIRLGYALLVGALLVPLAGQPAAATIPAPGAGDQAGTADRAGAAERGVPAAAAATPQLVPKPSTMVARPNDAFAIERDTKIVARSGKAGAVAGHLAGILRRSTGFALPVVSGGAGGGRAISLDLDGPRRLGAEGYVLDVSRGAARLSAHAPAGLFRGVQTFRQLMPAKVESPAVRPGPWPVAGVRIDDKPRFGWRGAMLDVSRHFFSVAEVKRYIDLASLYKINMLHLHLSDDQGWRIAIDSWPRLTTHGGSLEVGGTPGGFYTKRDYREIIRYAADQFITVVPEIDMPGHTNAALASYAELNCDGKAPPLYTGIEVGFSSLCVPLDITYRFIDDVVGEIAEMTPGPYFHIGGDEAHSTTPQDYVTFIDKVRDIVAKHGKRLVGWKEISAASIKPGSTSQYWGFSPTTPDAAEQARAAVRKGAKLVFSPANRIYLDMKYHEQTPYGLSWAGFVEVRESYSWDPATVVEGITDADIRGVEAPLWSETLDSTPPVEFMAFPRLPGAAEIGWSPMTGRSWDEYRLRLAAHGPRWEQMSVNFYRSPQVPWPAAAQ